MATDRQDALRTFHPLIADWFQTEVGTPTAVQEQAWAAIGSGHHCVITAPTGSGKTLAAFLIAIDALVRGSGGRVLYISPLKALNNDIERNLNRPLAALRERFRLAGAEMPEINVRVRSGDTDPTERRRLTSHPPHILVTTPESLNLMLSSRSGLRALRGFTTVILDEIHAVLSNKRGAYLMAGVERLVPLCGEFQRIALSATVRPLETVAGVVGGFRRGKVDGEIGGEPTHEARAVVLVQGEGEKRYDLTVAFPGEDSTARPPSSEGDPELWWSTTARFLRDRIAANRSTLIFANSRRSVEKLARFLNELPGEPVYAHHGSLSREVRQVVESRLKNGELKAIVATSSLELGIDIGQIDEVVLVQAPFAISAAIQRIGRAGHGVGAVSRGLLLPLHSGDLPTLAVIARAVAEGQSEPIAVPDQPLDVLAQVVTSMVLFEPLALEEVFARLRCVYHYRHLSRAQFELVIEMLAGRYADLRIRELRPRITYDRLHRSIQARSGAAMLLYLSGGVIPDRGYYTLRRADNGGKIGELDEEFVWERSVGDGFPLGNRAWRITRITANEVEVMPTESTDSIVPFWRAEELSRPAELSEAVGSFLELCEKRLTDPSFVSELQDGYALSRRAATELVRYLHRQREHTACALPHRHHLVIESWVDPRAATDTKQVILHTLWGNSVNKPLAHALSAAWQALHRSPLEVFANNDAVLIQLPGDYDPRAILDLVQPAEIPRLLRESLEGGALFGALFRENAQRALLLPRRGFKERMPLWLNRLRSRKLLESVAAETDFPITIETWRECLQDRFDLPRLQQLLDEVDRGEIRLSPAETATPSPFSSAIVWRETAVRIYQDDSAGILKTALDEELLGAVLRGSQLRPEIPEAQVSSLERKLQRTAAGYAPDSAEELVALLSDRLFIPEAEWQELCRAIERDADRPAAVILDAAQDRIRRRAFDSVTGYYAREREALIEAAFSASGDPGAPHPKALFHVLTQWLQFYGPVPLSRLQAILPADPMAFERALDQAVQDDLVLLDRFTTGSAEPQVCDRENLERLLRLRRAAARSDVPAVSLPQFQYFLARRQGISHPGKSMEELETRLERLFGYPARADLWESEFLSARLTPYYPAWLDSAMAGSELLWFGAGTERITLGFESDLDLFRSVERDRGASVGAAERVLSTLRDKGPLALLDLCDEVAETTDTVTAALWELVWSGQVQNDGMHALRQGVEHHFSAESVRALVERGSFNRWRASRPMAGRWMALPTPEPAADALEEAERVKERIRVLLDRYGIIFRELLRQELGPLQWKAVVHMLRIMELSGEVVAGHFVAGLPGIQFATPAAVRELGEVERPVREHGDEPIYWMNAADPASLCGLDLAGAKGWLPPRVPTTHLVFHGAELVVISQRSGKSLAISVEPSAPQLPEYLSQLGILLSREVSPLKRLRVEEINGEPALASPFGAALRTVGFVSDGAGLSLWKRF